MHKYVEFRTCALPLCSPPASVAPDGAVGATSADFVDAGMTSFLPIFNFFGSTPGFAASIALAVVPWALAILPSVSPATMVYSEPPVSTACGGGTTGGKLVTTGGGIGTGGLVSTTGVLVIAIARALVSTGGSAFNSSDGFSRLQPWMSMATRPVTLTASTQKTASLMRERRWLCCSSSEPLGTNGFGLFITLLAQMRPLFEVVVFGFEFSAAELSLEKLKTKNNHLK